MTTLDSGDKRLDSRPASIYLWVLSGVHLRERYFEIENMMVHEKFDVSCRY